MVVSTSSPNLFFNFASTSSSSSDYTTPSRQRMSALPRLLVTAVLDNDDKNNDTARFLRSNSVADFLRFKKGEVGGAGGELQTAVVSYRKKFPFSLLNPFLQVDLVSTIHIADQQYFDTLQRGLKHYDCVLYEMVASRESLENRLKSRSTKKLKSSHSRGFNVIGFIQRQMARVLSLDFQLDCLDYENENWLHADLDYETFQSLQNERGENFFTLAKEMTLRSTKALVLPDSINLDPWKSKLLWASRVLPMPLVGLFIISSVCSPIEGNTAEYSEIEALSRLDIGAALKIFLAKRLTSDFGEITAAIEEKSVIIGERNRIATEALRRAIGSGHCKIAVLYGGGHMPDLGRRLREEFDMVPSQVNWITAWSISNRELRLRPLPFLKKLAKISGWPLNRYETLALLLFSSVLAVDLWLWELFVDSAVKLASSAVSEVSMISNLWRM